MVFQVNLLLTHTHQTTLIFGLSKHFIYQQSGSQSDSLTCKIVSVVFCLPFCGSVHILSAISNPYFKSRFPTLTVFSYIISTKKHPKWSARPPQYNEHFLYNLSATAAGTKGVWGSWTQGQNHGQFIKYKARRVVKGFCRDSENLHKLAKTIFYTRNLGFEGRLSKVRADEFVGKKQAADQFVDQKWRRDTLYRPRFYKVFEPSRHRLSKAAVLYCERTEPIVL